MRRHRAALGTAGLHRCDSSFPRPRAAPATTIAAVRRTTTAYAYDRRRQSYRLRACRRCGRARGRPAPDAAARLDQDPAGSAWLLLYSSRICPDQVLKLALLEFLLDQADRDNAGEFRQFGMRKQLGELHRNAE